MTACIQSLAKEFVAPLAFFAAYGGWTILNYSHSVSLFT